MRFSLPSPKHTLYFPSMQIIVSYFNISKRMSILFLKKLWVGFVGRAFLKKQIINGAFFSLKKEQAINKITNKPILKQATTTFSQKIQF